VSKYEKGQVLQYKDSSDNISSAEIIKVHFDDELEPFYTIKLPCGKEKQTDDAHLIVPEVSPIQKEIEKMLPSFSSEQLQQIHEFMRNLQGSGPAVSSNETHGAGTPVHAPTPSYTGGMAPAGSQAQAAGGIPSPSHVKAGASGIHAVPAPPLYQQQPPPQRMQQQQPSQMQQQYAQQQQAQMAQQQPPPQHSMNQQAPHQGQLGGQVQQMTQQPHMQQPQQQMQQQVPQMQPSQQQMQQHAPQMQPPHQNMQQQAPQMQQQAKQMQPPQQQMQQQAPQMQPPQMQMQQADGGHPLSPKGNPFDMF
jgi:hypothetical protein